MTLPPVLFAPRWPLSLRAPLAVSGGVLLGLGHAPFSLPVLALLGLVLVCGAVLRAADPRSAAFTAWLGGAAYFALVLHWIVEPFLVDAARHGWMAPFALVFLAGGLALFWGAAGWITGRTRGAGRQALVLALALSAAEVARSTVLSGLPWGLIGGIWINGPAAAWLSWVGPHGLGLLTLLCVAGVWALWPRAPRLAALPVLLGPLALVGAGLLQPPAPAMPPDAPIVRLVQPNAAQHLKWKPDWIGVFYRRQLGMTAAAGAPALTVWPETATALQLPYDASGLTMISAAAQDRPVVLGLNRFDGQQIYNSLQVLGPAGTITQSYDKARLVPFGEYIPLGDLAARFGIYGLAALDGFGYSAGPGAQLLDLGPLGKALPLICYEAIFPGFGRALSAEADFMLHLTNDAWFGRFAGPQQHLDLARMRARERGVPVVRVANTGISAMIDARGQVLASLPLNETGFLDTPLPPRAAPTFYARFGPLPAVVLWLCLAFAAFAHRRARPD